MTLTRLFRGAVRHAALWPLKAIGADARADAIAAITEQSIARLTVAGAHLSFFAPSPLLRHRAASLATKEPDMIAWLNGIDRDDVLWDIGANVGVFSVYAAAVRHCQVVAFEPSAATFFVLTRNIQLNALSDRVVAYPVAIAGATSLGVLNLDSIEPGTAMSQFGRVGEASRYSSNRHPITQGMVGYNIDDFIAQFDVALPTHLKIDVDGLEWPILQGAAAALRNPRLRAVMVELSITDDGERQHATELLESCGLRFQSRGEVQGAAGEQAANHLFVRDK